MCFQITASVPHEVGLLTSLPRRSPSVIQDNQGPHPGSNVWTCPFSSVNQFSRSPTGYAGGPSLVHNNKKARCVSQTLTPPERPTPRVSRPLTPCEADPGRYGAAPGSRSSHWLRVHCSADAETYLSGTAAAEHSEAFSFLVESTCSLQSASSLLVLRNHVKTHLFRKYPESHALLCESPPPLLPSSCDKNIVRKVTVTATLLVAFLLSGVLNSRLNLLN